jgi:hypothetical protein
MAKDAVIKHKNTLPIHKIVQVMVFWDVALHFIIDRYQRFAGKPRLHHQGQAEYSSNVVGYMGRL